MQAEGVRCAVKAVVNFLLCTFQPALPTFSLYCRPSTYTAHTVYQVVIIVLIGMPSLDIIRICQFIGMPSLDKYQNKMAQECHLL